MTRRRTGYSRALANREFRSVCLAQFTSELGDQVAAIALSYLVYTRSNSAFFAALTYAIAHLPWIVGSIVLSPLADRMSRRRLMLICDAARMVVIGSMALAAHAGAPLWVLFVLVLVSASFAPVFAAARGSILPDILGEGEDYVAGVALGRILQQGDLVLGFAVGGLVVAAVSASGALAIDAASFAVSFVLLIVGVRHRPAAGAAIAGVRDMLQSAAEGVRSLIAEPARRTLLLFTAVAVAFLVAPEGLAVVYAKQQGEGAAAAGLLSAAAPLGIAIGAWLLVRYVRPHHQGLLVLPLGALAMLPIAATALEPPVWLACVLWLLSGMAQCFVVPTIAAFNVVTEAAMRGRANGIAGATIAVTQGLGFVVWGALGSWLGAAASIAWAGVAGLIAVTLFRATWPHGAMAQAWQRLDVAGAPAPETAAVD